MGVDAAKSHDTASTRSFCFSIEKWLLDKSAWLQLFGEFVQFSLLYTETAHYTATESENSRRQLITRQQSLRIAETAHYTATESENSRDSSLHGNRV